jgi:hypothetical protein
MMTTKSRGAVRRWPTGSDHGRHQALRELAGALPNINSLTITPDLLSGALAGLMAGRSAE